MSSTSSKASCFASEKSQYPVLQGWQVSSAIDVQAHTFISLKNLVQALSSVLSVFILLLPSGSFDLFLSLQPLVIALSGLVHSSSRDKARHGDLFQQYTLELQLGNKHVGVCWSAKNWSYDGVCQAEAGLELPMRIEPAAKSHDGRWGGGVR